MKNGIHLLFDFDGTLVDSFQTVVETFNFLSDQFNFRKIKTDEIESLRELSSKELLKFLKIPIYKIPSVILAVRKQLHKEILSLLPFDNLPSVLKTLFDANVDCGIVTSNSAENVSVWLTHNKMDNLFKFTHIESNYFSKGALLKKLLKLYNLDKSNVFYIGDETRDIEAAKESGVHSVAVSWGYTSEKKLALYEPDYFVRRPEDLLGLLNKAFEDIQ